MPDGQSYGPYSTQAVRQYVADGRIPPMANVVQEATGVQMALSRAGFLPDVPPPTPPPAPVVAVRQEPRGHFQRHWMTYLIVGIVCVVLVVPMLIMAAIMFPVFAKAKDKARQAACLSNIKQIAMACQLYAADNGDTFPPGPDYQGFHDQVFPYVQNEGLFKCPSAPNEQGYAFNPNLAAMSIKKVPLPADTPMLWDAGAQLPGLQPPAGTTAGRHSDGDNVGFADGHAKWLGLDGLSSLSPQPAAAGATGD